MNYEAVILHMLSKIEKERTVNSVYHILRGKRSAQTIQDMQLFRLQPFYNIYPNLDEESYEHIINTFHEKGWIQLTDDTFQLNNSGLTLIDENLLVESLKFNGMKYHRVAQNFFKTLQLLCQTLSNLIYENNQFIPIVDDVAIQRKVKQIMKRYKSNRTDLYDGLFLDLYTIFNELDTEPIDLFAMQLTSANQIGLSKRQIAEKNNRSIHDVHFITVHIVHQMLYLMDNDQDKYQYLRQLIDSHENITLTDSSSKTYRLLRQGKTIEQISQIRRLKMSTIEDHIVELATQIRDFSIRPFVNESVEKEIIETLNNTNTLRLKFIKDMLPETVTYFQIRLVMTRWNDILQDGEGR